MGEEDLIEKLSEKIAYLKNILVNIPGCVYWKGLSGTYMGCNRLFWEMVGLKSEEEVIGKTDDDFCWKEQAHDLRSHDLMVIREAKTTVLEEEVSLANHEKRLYSVIKAPLFDNDGNIIGIVGTSIDINYRKEIEESLKRAKIQADEASKSKSEFIANMSHDIRTPITGIIGMMQDMLNTTNQAEASLDANNTESASALKNVIKTVQRDGHYLMSASDELLQLCNEILEVVSLESKNIQDNAKPFNIHALITHNIELLQPAAQHKKLQLLYDIDDSVPQFLIGSRIYLDRVLLNLISNSLKFTEKGWIKVSVKLAHSGNHNTSVIKGTEVILKILVEDTGIGIPEDKFDVIFEHFSRLTPAYEGLYKGAGLGLYTVKRYIKAMHGSIDVSSKLNQGTCFTVTVPVKVSDHAYTVQNPSQASKQTNKYIKKSVAKFVIQDDGRLEKNYGFSILIVEDSMLAAVAVISILKSFNCHIERAENGKQAVEMATDGSYDLILMDIGLPDFSGIEVTKKIRALGDVEKSQVPIVALTGHANSPEMRQEALDSGIQEVMSKPARLSDLEVILQRYVFGSNVKEMSVHKGSTSSVDTNKDSIIDWKACVSMFKGDAELTKDMLSMIDEDLTNVKLILSEAYAKRDKRTLREELHRCRGGVCYLKLPELEQTLEKFHEAVKKNPPDENQLEQTYTALMQAIENFKLMWKDNYTR